LYTGVQDRYTTSYVCSSFVVGCYKAAGLFGNLTINPQEFSPKDLYNLNFFNTTVNRPQQCVDADPESTFCQLLGKYRMKFPGVSTIDPYENMDERCPTIAPEYVRPDGC